MKRLLKRHASAAMTFYLNGELLGGENRHVQRVLICTVLLYLVNQNFHLGLESGIFLLQSLKGIGDIVEIILDRTHVGQISKAQVCISDIKTQLVPN